MLKKIILCCLFLLVGACSSSLIAPLPKQPVASQAFVVSQLPQHEKSLLVIQFQAQQWRWLQTDPLGAPLARLLLTHQGWQHDGFVMPNKQAQQLFSAMTTYLNENYPLFAFSRIDTTPVSKDYFIHGKKVWSLMPIKNGVKIDLADGSQWLIETLEQ